MTAPHDSKSTSGLSVWTRTVLAGLAVLCVLLIAAVGVLKLKMDSAEVKMAAPDSSFSLEAETTALVSRALGYGGFLGSAQNLILKQDANALGEMRETLQTARNAIEKLNGEAPAILRHDLSGILTLYAATLSKAEQGGLALVDLGPLAATVPALDSRLQTYAAMERRDAQGEFRLTSTGLAIVAWGCLIGMASLAAGLFLALRDRYARPLQSLQQSVTNITKGDMKTSVWGMERTDAIGDLARAIDLARYHFSQMPDLSLMSEQGPVRLRFEGETRSAFDAMMNTLAQSYVKAETQSEDFMKILNAEQEILSGLADRMNIVLSDLKLSSSEAGDTSRKLIRYLADSAKAMADSQELLAARVGQLVPFMQERAHNMAEVTTLIGTQASQTLHKLGQAEMGLRNSAVQSQKTIQDFAQTTNEMTERLFAALNIMQASSRVMTETTETAQSRFNEAVDTLGRGENTLQDVLSRAEERLKNTINAEENLAALALRTENNADRMEVAVTDLMRRNDTLNEQVIETTHRMEQLLNGFDTASSTMNDAVSSIRRDSSALGGVLQDLRGNNDQLLASVTQNSQTSFATIQNLTERAQALMQRLEIQISQQAQSVETRVNDIASQGGAMAQQIQSTTSALAQTVSSLRMEQEKFVSTRAKFAETVTDISAKLERETTGALAHTTHLTQKGHEKLALLADQMDGVLSRLNIMGQLTGTLGAVAGQLGQLVPVLTQATPSLAPATASSPETVLVTPDMAAFARDILNGVKEAMRQEWNEAVAQIERLTMEQARDIGALVLNRDEIPADMQSPSSALSAAEILAVIQKPWEDVLARIDDLSVPFVTKVDTSSLAKSVQLELQSQMHRAIVQIEAMNDQLAQMMLDVKDQLETRLMVMDRKIKTLADNASDEDTPRAVSPSATDPTAMMSEIANTIAALTNQIGSIDSTMDIINENLDAQAGGKG